MDFAEMPGRLSRYIGNLFAVKGFGQLIVLTVRPI